MKVLVAQSYPSLCDPLDCSPPGSSVLGILQARILEWVAIPFTRGSSQPRDWAWVSCIAGRLFTIWATREELWLCFSLLTLSSSKIGGSSFPVFWSLWWFQDMFVYLLLLVISVVLTGVWDWKLFYFFLLMNEWIKVKIKLLYFFLICLILLEWVSLDFPSV